MTWRQSTFALPLLIGLLSALGLFCALLGDGWWGRQRLVRPGYSRRAWYLAIIATQTLMP